jgi:transcriptional regulator GlxA family with amidase domain
MDQRVQRVILFMESNVCREMSLSELARAVNLSVSHLCHIFKDETGTTPIKHFRLLKIQKAKSLLETSFLSVKEIMNEVGVNDESHFVREFKKTCELTPTQYRSRYHRLAKNN